jgi:small-conductance mechanosensitive channel
METLSVPPLIQELLADLRQVSLLWQIGIVTSSLGIAWLVDRFVAPQVRADHAALSLGAAGLRRVMFPLTALCVVALGRAVLHKLHHPVHLLDLAVPLLLSLAIIRLTVYMLHYVQPASALVKRFERVFSGAVWIGFALYVTGLGVDLVGLLEEIRLPLGRGSITLLAVINGLLAISVALLLSLWLGRMAETRLMGATEMDINIRVVLSKVLQASLVLIAIMIALPAVGIDLTTLSVFGGALGVGLGFGLQKIASNYVSGFIILLDRSVSPGQIVTVDKREGQVTKMTARCLVLRSVDGTESIIPNETLITSTVINHCRAEPRLRVGLPVPIAYGSDVERARGIMLSAATSQPRVLHDPAPVAAIKNLGGHGIELDLGFFVGDPEQGTAGLATTIYEAILRDFEVAGIKFPRHEDPASP